eukprot:759327-Hanusia_phi.AAC.6
MQPCGGDTISNPNSGVFNKSVSSTKKNSKKNANVLHFEDNRRELITARETWSSGRGKERGLKSTKRGLLPDEGGEHKVNSEEKHDEERQSEDERDRSLLMEELHGLMSEL